jgi:hypothetical protein
MMTGIGTPRSQSKMPRPIATSFSGLPTRISARAGIIELEFLSPAPRAHCSDQAKQRGRWGGIGRRRFFIPADAPISCSRHRLSQQAAQTTARENLRRVLA